MASKILCAGFSKEEKSAVEAEVKPVIAARPREESWTISLVKTGTRLAVTVDGPDERLRSKNFVSELWELRQKLMDLLTNNGFPPTEEVAPAPKPVAPPRPPAPAPVPAPAPTPVAKPSPRPAPVVAKPAPAAPTPKAAPAPAAVRPAAAVAPPAQPRVAAPLTPPPSRVVSPPPPAAPLQELEEEYDWESPHAAGERRETHACAKCKRRFAVIYEAVPGEPRYTVAVACPHCWEVDHIQIGENAALSKQYRADKLKD